MPYTTRPWGSAREVAGDQGFVEQTKQINIIDGEIKSLWTERQRLFRKLEEYCRSAFDTKIQQKQYNDALDKNFDQIKGNLIYVDQCYFANKQIIDSGAAQFLFKEEKERLGNLQMKLARIRNENVGFAPYR